MPDVAKLKKKAAEFELKKQFDKALATYVEILDRYGKRSNEEVDLALYNRVGDLFLKQGNVADALDYYEQAVDRYAEGGFFNNAIALCNKILRNSPGRASVYYKLGKISAHKGFKGDAKANFLEYADRMQRAGNFDESFRALKEFADLCPDQDDIRLMLADQLTKKGRGPEAVEQLQTLYERYMQEGREAEARATVDRMKAIDPSSEPRAAGSAPRRQAGDLVFLDLDDAAPAAPRAATPVRPAAPPPAPPKPAPRPATGEMDALARRATAGLDIIDTGNHAEIPAPPPPRPAAPTPPPQRVQPPAPAPEPEIFYTPEPEPMAAAPEVVELEMYEPEVFEPEVLDEAPPAARGGTSGLLEGLETTSFEAPRPSSSGGLLDLEPTSFGEPLPPSARPPRVSREVKADPAFGGELLDFEMPEKRTKGPREVAPREVVPPPAPPPAAARPAAPPPAAARPAAPPPAAARPAAPPPAAARPAAPPPAAFQPPAPAPARPAFDDLPMLEEPGQYDDQGSAGGDLELIMPEEDSGPDIPMMDLDLPVSGEATAHITGYPAVREEEPASSDLEMVDFSGGFDTAASAAAELSPAELDVRADLDLDVAPLSRPTGGFAAIPVSREPSGAFPTVPAEREDSGEYEPIPATPRRSSTMLAAQSVEMLQAMADGDPEDLDVRRRLAEAMLESGDREGGLRELEAAMVGYERNDDLTSAAALADEIVLLNPGSVRHHQKRVEYAFRTNERGRLIEAYLALADALFRAEQLEKSRAIYQRVLDLSPDDLRANAALQSFPAPEPVPAAPPPPPTKGRPSAAMPRPAAPLKPVATGDDDFVNLGDWLRDDEAPKDTRMVVAEEEPTGDEEADFQDMLRKFKQGIAENVEDEDHQSHYDLGVAYKEMGLLDEAIAEFQKALRGPANRVPTYEALGQCFIEKEQYPMAATILQRALAEKGVTDDQLVGVLYLLGVCAEQRGQRDEAVAYYQRVFVVDIQFRDVGDRLAAVESGL